MPMQPDDSPIPFESPQAATYETRTGWFDRHGRFHGDDEEMARLSGCTHLRCQKCQTLHPKGEPCPCCDRESLAEWWAKLPRNDWDGEAFLYSYSTNQFFNTGDDVAHYCFENNLSIDALQLVICVPSVAEPIDPLTYYEDLLPEAGSIPVELADAFDVLNGAITSRHFVLSWYPGKEVPTEHSLLKP